jgi:calcineurin-like phosphoesterase family protein
MITELLQPLYLEYITEEIFSQYKQRVQPRYKHPEMWRRLGEQYCGQTIAPQGNVWVWSDHHFGHKNIIGFSDRPYDDTTHMREDMIRNHNCFVENDDTCIFVGDFAFLPDKEANEILLRMKGRKILIIGNHDVSKKKLKKLRFDEIYLCAHMEADGIDFMFTHFPMRNIPEWCFNIHGHEHINHLFTDTHNHFNVNCELHDYCPVPLQDIVWKAKVRLEAKD